MAIQNGKCPDCGGSLILDSLNEKSICKFCGSEFVVQQAIQKLQIDGIATFDALFLAAQQTLDKEQDFDKARKKYKEALNLRPNDYRVLWGLFLCEASGIDFAYHKKGYIQIEGDIPSNVNEIIHKYGMVAIQNAPLEIQNYYFQEIEKYKLKYQHLSNKRKKEGCYIASAVYGSYNCPEVWVLRRYRDERLKKHLFGRIFIRTYYFFSPKLVKIFKNKHQLNLFIKKRLDKKVKKLKEKGFQDTIYFDSM